MGRDPGVLVTGAGGQVGRALREWLPGATYAARAELDVRDAAAVGAAVPPGGVVVNLAALTDVDGCERDPGLAHAVNAGGAGAVAAAAAAAGARVIQVSTEYVFDGEGEGELAEDAATAPRNAYGASKLEGERRVLAASSQNLVVRTSWVFGDGRNFVRTIVAAARAGRRLRVVCDQRGRPTGARELARALAHLAARPLAGVVHVAGDGDPCSWADLAELGLAAAGLDVPVERVTSEQYAAERPGTAPRPRNAVLALGRARACGVPLAPWRPALTAYAGALR